MDAERKEALETTEKWHLFSVYHPRPTKWNTQSLHKKNEKIALRS